jgi:ATP-dependent DNA helicase RecG
MALTSLRFLKGVGPKRAQMFARIGINTPTDFLRYFPFRYEDRRNFKKIVEINNDDPVLVKGKVIMVKLKRIPYFRARRVKSVFELILDDGTQTAHCIWFNQHYLAGYIHKDDEIVIYGKPKRDGLLVKFNSPQYEKAGKESSLDIGRIVGIYHSTQGLTQKFLRKIFFDIYDSEKNNIIDHIPFSVREKEELPNIIKSIHDMHLPEKMEDIDVARRRFIFEELFFSQIMVYLRKAARREQKTITLKNDENFLKRFKANLGFDLTGEQEAAINDIITDVGQTYPMHRLLQGDVGCGKTVVAAVGLGLAAQGGFQAALMVPTEVLAYQHKESLENIFKGFDFKIEVLVSSLAKEKSAQVISGLNSGEIQIVVGTHALIQDNVAFKKLALTVIDEQHKFGVAQRALLPKKGLPSPHCLVMSATPIPRSLALSLYGDLDLSVIKVLPSGRKPCNNRWVDETKREEVYSFLRKQLKDGRQAYIVYPAIEEGDDSDVEALDTAFEKLKSEFVDYKVGMFHGRMKAMDKNRVVENFRNKKVDILLCTTVVEVGVSVDNATTMIVENPERFGLSQLHQLRGRVKRSDLQPHFILISKLLITDKAIERLKVITKTDDGFLIAENDLILRGPGDFFGDDQHGLPVLAMANPLRDLEALKGARFWAHQIISGDRNLEKHENKPIREHLAGWFNAQENDAKSVAA